MLHTCVANGVSKTTVPFFPVNFFPVVDSWCSYFDTWIFGGVVLIISLTINYKSLCRTLRHGFLLPIKARSRYMLEWLVGKLYFGGAQVITNFGRDISIRALPIERIMVVVV